MLRLKTAMDLICTFVTEICGLKKFLKVCNFVQGKWQHLLQACLIDRGLPPESLNKVLLDVALQKHDQSRVTVSSCTQLSVPSTTSMPSDTNTYINNTQHQSMQYRSPTSHHTEKQTTTTTITTAAALSTPKFEGGSLVAGQSLYPPGSYTHSNLPTQFSTAPNTLGNGPSYVLDSHLHNTHMSSINMASSRMASPLYSNFVVPPKSYGIREAESYSGFSQNKAFNSTQTQGNNSSQSYNNNNNNKNTQNHSNATQDNLQMYNKERLNVSPKPTMSQDYTIPKDYIIPKDFKPPKEYNDSKDYKNAKEYNSTKEYNAAKEYNKAKEYSAEKEYKPGKGNMVGPQNASMAKEGPLALSGNPPVRSCDMQKYILLSPVLGPKPVLLSPMYDKADQSQARFVIVPMENKRRPSLCSIVPANSSPLLAIEDFTSCQLLQEEAAKELVARRTVEEEEEMEAGVMLHNKTQDTTMQMLTHSRQDTADSCSPNPICLSLQQNNLSSRGGAPPMSRDHQMPDLLYNNKVVIAF